MTEQAVATCQVDNDKSKVTEWRFAPGAATGFHTHAYDYVVVPMTTGQLRIVAPDGDESLRDLEVGRSYFGTAGTAHDVINANDHEFTFVEVEFK